MCVTGSCVLKNDAVMRKFLVFIVFATFTASSLCCAQNTGCWRLEGGLGFYSVFDRGNSNVRHSEIVESYDVKSYDGIVYENESVILPTLFVAGGYVFPEAPVGLFLDLYANYAWNNLKGGPAVLHEKELILHLLPELRLYYVRRHGFDLYASLAAGARMRNYSEVYQGDRIDSTGFDFSWQVSPLGASYGEHWYFTWEMGWGRAFSAVKVNCGFRF